MDWSLLALPVAGGVRSLAGWVENALKDGQIESFEWGQLLGTILEVGVISVATMFGLGLSAEQSAGVGVLGSMIFSKIKSAFGTI